MFEIKKEFSSEEKNEIMKTVKSRIDSLPAKIAEIKKMEVGINVRDSDRAFDMALVSEFESIESLMAYMNHPAHVEVAEYIKTVRDRSFMVDYVI